MDNSTTIDDLKKKVRKFCEDRDWDQFHNAKDLAIGIITESSELLEHFRFKTNEEVEQFFKNPKKKNEISEELADIVFFVLRLAQRYNIDVSSALEKKIIKNGKNYPLEISQGLIKKIQ